MTLERHEPVARKGQPGAIRSVRDVRDFHVSMRHTCIRVGEVLLVEKQIAFIDAFAVSFILVLWRWSRPSTTAHWRITAVYLSIGESAIMDAVSPIRRDLECPDAATNMLMPCPRYLSDQRKIRLVRSLCGHCGPGGFGYTLI